MGGNGGNGNVEFASILAGGGLGAWQPTSVFAISRFANNAVSHNGYIYMMGGCSNPACETAPQNDTQSVRLRSIPRTGTFSRLYDFDVGVRPTKIITRGSKLAGGAVNLSYNTVNNTANVFTNSQSAADIGFTGTNPLGLSLGSNVTLSRYLLLRYSIDDSRFATFPDSAGGQSTITDFDVYYTANPSSRLRGGRTFTNGADRGLDAPPL